MLNFSAAEAFPKTGLITMKNPRASANEAAKNFTFDSVFAADVMQIDIYNTCAASVVESVLNGYNGTIFAYGQTGAGRFMYNLFSVHTLIFAEMSMCDNNKVLFVNR